MSTTQSLVPAYQGKKKMSVPPATDTINELHPIVDYSFCRITNVKDMEEEDPRPSVMSPRKTKAQQQQEETEEKQKSESRGLRLNNNALTNLSELYETAGKIFVNPEEIAWIDLSFNEIKEIDSRITMFQNLQILYLHGNLIENVEDLDKLQSLPHLRKLTVHGNPLETKFNSAKDCRNKILAMFPNLMDVNFSGVTKCEQRSVKTWKKQILASGSKKKKAKRDED